MSVCMNCNTHTSEDMDVISHLIKIRLKPKVLLNHYMLCVRSGRAGREAGGSAASVGGPGPHRRPVCSARVQGTAECAQGQPGHHHQVRDFQRALQRAEPKQHADALHRAAAQPGAGAKGGPAAGRGGAHWCLLQPLSGLEGRPWAQGGAGCVVSSVVPVLR